MASLLDTSFFIATVCAVRSRCACSRSPLRAFAVVASVAIVVAAWPSVAPAGTYSTYSCHTPTGGWASTEGWLRAGNDPNGILRDDCEVAGANEPNGTLHAARNPTWPGGYMTHVSWVYRPPAGTTIAGFRAGMCAYSERPTAISIGPAENPLTPGTMLHGPPPVSASGYLGCTGGRPYWNTYESGFGGNYVERTGLEAAELWWSVWCTGQPCEAGYGRAWLDIASVRFDLRDDRAPIVSRVAGSLAGSTAINGSLTASYDAMDVGGGLFRTFVEAKINQSGEWRTLVTEFVDRLGGRCAPAGVTNSPYEFLYPSPCRGSVTNASVVLPSGLLPAGDHLVRAQLEDAGGNRTDVVPPRILHVEPADRGRTLSGGSGTSPRESSRDVVPDNGRGASTRAIVKLRRSGKTTRYGAKLDVRGRLVDENDRPIVGARLQVDWRRLIPRRGLRGSGWKPLGKVTTGSAGRFVARIPTSMSRALRFSYKANLAQDGFTSAAQYGLRVRAHVAVRATRARVRNGQAAVFVGRVLDTPRGGVPLSLQALVVGRGWTPARTTPTDARTGRKGRFRLAYRFARTYQRTAYIFRLVVGEDSSFPFVQTASRRIRVMVRP